MKCAIINLPRATRRRRVFEKEFNALGVPFEVWPAVDGRSLTDEDRAHINVRVRKSLGLYPIPDGSLANTLSQRAVWRQFVASGDQVMAIFEDDVLPEPQLPRALEALERHSGNYDVVMLNRGHPKKPYFPVAHLSTGHSIGRVRFASPGSCGYVISRFAAKHLLAKYPRMVWEIDQVLTRFWENDLNVLYIDPPVIFPSKAESLIEPSRDSSRREHRRQRSLVTIARQVAAAVSRDVHRRILFHRLLKNDRRNR